jgi:hypothetical protein
MVAAFPTHRRPLMAKFIVSLSAPLAREYEVVADDMDAAIEIATAEFVKDFPVAANTTEIDEFDVEVSESYEIDNDGNVVDSEEVDEDADEE